MVEAIGWLAIFVGGGIGFSASLSALVMFLARRHEIGALIYADMAFKAAIVLWIGLFLWFAPITISFGVSQ